MIGDHELLAHRDPACKAGFSRATDDPETEDYRPPAEHAPFLSGIWANTLTVAAAHPTERHGAIVLHPELVSSWRREILWWLAADKDGNVVGQVDRYSTQRGATRYRWRTILSPPEGLIGGEGFTSTRSACKALAAATGLAGAGR